MILWTELARAADTAGDEINLRRKGDLYGIYFDDLELMSNINHRSETVLAERSFQLHGDTVRRILITGLGISFTLHAALFLAKLRRVTEADDTTGKSHSVGGIADVAKPISDPKPCLPHERLATKGREPQPTVRTSDLASSR